MPVTVSGMLQSKAARSAFSFSCTDDMDETLDKLDELLLAVLCATDFFSAGVAAKDTLSSRLTSSKCLFVIQVSTSVKKLLNCTFFGLNQYV